MAKRATANMNVLAWLKKMPQPAYVLADDRRIDVPRTSRPWPELADTLASLGPDKLTACDKDGNVIRAREYPTTDGPSEEGGLGVTGNTDLQVLAKLLAEAYEKGSVSYQPLLGSAMGFIERQGVTIANQEKEIARLRMHNVKLQAEILSLSGAQAPEGTDENDLATNILMGVLQASQQQAQPALPANGKTANPPSKPTKKER